MDSPTLILPGAIMTDLAGVEAALGLGNGMNQICWQTILFGLRRKVVPHFFLSWIVARRGLPCRLPWYRLVLLRMRMLL